MTAMGCFLCPASISLMVPSSPLFSNPLAGSQRCSQRFHRQAWEMRVLGRLLCLLSLVVLILPSSRHREAKDIVQGHTTRWCQSTHSPPGCLGVSGQTGWGKGVPSLLLWSPENVSLASQLGVELEVGQSFYSVELRTGSSSKVKTGYHPLAGVWIFSQLFSLLCLPRQV